MTSRPSTAPPILAVLAIVLVVLGIYVGGYFWLGRLTTFAGSAVRIYETKWQREFFAPGTKIESALTGSKVHPFQQSRHYRSP